VGKRSSVRLLDTAEMTLSLMERHRRLRRAALAGRRDAEVARLVALGASVLLAGVCYEAALASARGYGEALLISQFSVSRGANAR
jgi:hypothetical protein